MITVQDVAAANIVYGLWKVLVPFAAAAYITLTIVRANKMLVHDGAALILSRFLCLGLALAAFLLLGTPICRLILEHNSGNWQHAGSPQEQGATLTMMLIFALGPVLVLLFVVSRIMEILALRGWRRSHLRVKLNQIANALS